MKRLLSALGAVVAVSTATVAVVPAAPALASCGNAVIESMPLINAFTGQSSWNYGYVQLWYDYCNGDNWSRTVAGPDLSPANISEIFTVVYNTVPLHKTGYTLPPYNNPPPLATSLMLYSPQAAGAYGVVYIVDSNDSYYAEADQSGANCADDYFGGEPCPT